MRYAGYHDSILAGTITRITPILLVSFVIVEFHALKDVIVEPDTDIGVRQYVAWHRDGTAAHIYTERNRRGRSISSGRPALDPGPAEPLPAAGGQMGSIGLGFCRTDTHEPAFLRSCGGTDGRADIAAIKTATKNAHATPRIFSEKAQLSAPEAQRGNVGSLR